MTEHTAVRRERARPMSPDERREAIVAATVPLLAEHGGTVTTRQIAQAAGIAEGTIFRVFPDKRALFQAVAQDVMNPPGGRDEMATYLAALPALRDKMVLVVERLEARSAQAMAVMMALRSVWMSEGPPRPEPGQPPGPPRFIVEANEQLLANLTDLLFAPHAAELRIPPEDAALALRSLVLGARHPGMSGGERRLSPTEVADILLDGVARPTKRGAR